VDRAGQTPGECRWDGQRVIGMKQRRVRPGHSKKEGLEWETGALARKGATHKQRLLSKTRFEGGTQYRTEAHGEVCAKCVGDREG